MEGGRDNTNPEKERDSSHFRLPENSNRPILQASEYLNKNLFPTPTSENILSPHILQASNLSELEGIKPELLMHEGVDKFMNYFSLRAEKGIPPDTVFFLDKKARPLAYLMRQLYKDYCPELSMPQVRFINIGRVYNGDSHLSEHKVPFLGDSSQIASMYNIDEHGRIVVVDEFSASGKGLKKAVEQIGKAFPKAEEVSGLTAFRSFLKWNFDTELLGIKEYTKGDYQEKSLEILNKELGTNYSEGGIEKFDEETSRRFQGIFEGIYGTIPTVKSHDIPKYYKAIKRKQGFFDKISGKSPEFDEVLVGNAGDSVRKELGQLAQEVREYHQHKTSSSLHL
jgi:hypothetical protein